jgi:hypothetical protein
MSVTSLFSTKLIDILNEPKINHFIEIAKMLTIHAAHAYCKAHKLHGSSSGYLIEKYIIDKFHMKKISSTEGCGDAQFNGVNIEIKASFGGFTHNRFNYVQIRPHHLIDHYLLTAYYLNKNNIDTDGELFMFGLPKTVMNEFLQQFGQYAHGIKSDDHRNEYAIRPVYGDSCWNELIKYRISELDINRIGIQPN